jgi:hypothetical protein
MSVIPPFALMQKVEPKNQGKPKWLRLFCRPTHGSSLYSIHHFLTSFQAAYCITAYNFFKTSCLYFRCNTLQALYPAFLFLKNIIHQDHAG